MYQLSISCGSKLYTLPILESDLDIVDDKQCIPGEILIDRLKAFGSIYNIMLPEHFYAFTITIANNDHGFYGDLPREIYDSLFKNEITGKDLQTIFDTIKETTDNQCSFSFLNDMPPGWQEDTLGFDQLPNAIQIKKFFDFEPDCDYPIDELPFEEMTLRKSDSYGCLYNLINNDKFDRNGTFLFGSLCIILYPHPRSLAITYNRIVSICSMIMLLDLNNEKNLNILERIYSIFKFVLFHTAQVQPDNYNRLITVYSVLNKKYEEIQCLSPGIDSTKQKIGSRLDFFARNNPKIILPTSGEALRDATGRSSGLAPTNFIWIF